jgi:PAN domain-containing protein
LSSITSSLNLNRKQPSAILDIYVDLNPRQIHEGEPSITRCITTRTKTDLVIATVRVTELVTIDGCTDEFCNNAQEQGSIERNPKSLQGPLGYFPQEYTTSEVAQQRDNPPEPTPDAIPPSFSPPTIIPPKFEGDDYIPPTFIPPKFTPPQFPDPNEKPSELRNQRYKPLSPQSDHDNGYEERNNRPSFSEQNGIPYEQVNGDDDRAALQEGLQPLEPLRRPQYGNTAGFGPSGSPDYEMRKHPKPKDNPRFRDVGRANPSPAAPQSDIPQKDSRVGSARNREFVSHFPYTSIPKSLPRFKDITPPEPEYVGERPTIQYFTESNEYTGPSTDEFPWGKKLSEDNGDARFRSLFPKGPRVDGIHPEHTPQLDDPNRGTRNLDNHPRFRNFPPSNPRIAGDTPEAIPQRDSPSYSSFWRKTLMAPSRFRNYLPNTWMGQYDRNVGKDYGRSNRETSTLHTGSTAERFTAYGSKVMHKKSQLNEENPDNATAAKLALAKRIKSKLTRVIDMYHPDDYSSLAKRQESLACPQADNVLYAGYRVYCNKETPGYHILAKRLPSFRQCLELCRNNPDCLSVSYIPPLRDLGECYLKDGFGPMAVRSGVWSARLDVPRSSSRFKCPEDNLRRVISRQGVVFEIRCGKEQVGGDMPNGVFAVEDEYDCMEICENRPGCQGVTIKRGMCILSDWRGGLQVSHYSWTARIISREMNYARLVSKQQDVTRSRSKATVEHEYSNQTSPKTNRTEGTKEEWNQSDVIPPERSTEFKWCNTTAQMTGKRLKSASTFMGLGRPFVAEIIKKRELLEPRQVRVTV